jgi:hypothetical protein
MACEPVMVETANRFARDLFVQETGWKRLNADGITLIAADAPEQFVDEFGKFWVPLPSLIKR